MTSREDLITLHNGEKTEPTFSKGEMQRRLEALRTMMAETGINACLFTSIHNIGYYSGFIYCSFGRPYGLVVTENTCTTISANIDYGQPWRRGHCDNLVYTDWQRDNFFVGVQINIFYQRGIIFQIRLKRDDTVYLFQFGKIQTVPTHIGADINK